MCGCRQTCRHTPFLRFDLACVYAGPKATASRKPMSFHAQTHIGRHECKQRVSREWWNGGAGGAAGRRTGSGRAGERGASRCQPGLPDLRFIFGPARNAGPNKTLPQSRPRVPSHISPLVQPSFLYTCLMTLKCVSEYLSIHWINNRTTSSVQILWTAALVRRLRIKIHFSSRSAADQSRKDFVSNPDTLGFRLASLRFPSFRSSRGHRRGVRGRACGGREGAGVRRERAIDLNLQPTVRQSNAR